MDHRAQYLIDLPAVARKRQCNAFQNSMSAVGTQEPAPLMVRLASPAYSPAPLHYKYPGAWMFDISDGEAQIVVPHTKGEAAADEAKPENPAAVLYVDQIDPRHERCELLRIKICPPRTGSAPPF